MDHALLGVELFPELNLYVGYNYISKIFNISKPEGQFKLTWNLIYSLLESIESRTGKKVTAKLLESY
jgi:hypothetical protein